MEWLLCVQYLKYVRILQGRQWAVNAEKPVHGPREVVLHFRPVCSLVKMDHGFI